MIRTLLALLAAVAFAVPAYAQTYPSKPIRLIVPFPPGGGTDFVARTVATELAKSTGWTVVVENKAGAAGTIGLVEASRAPNEGYDLVIGQADNMIIAPATLKNPGLDPAKDLTAVIQVAISPNLIMTQADSKFRTLGDAIAAAKAGSGVGELRHRRARHVREPRHRAPDADGRLQMGRGAVQGRLARDHRPARRARAAGRVVGRVGHAATSRPASCAGSS